MEQYERHPIGACYRDLAPDEYAKLKASLNDPGQSPAIVFENKILDGWHYYKACLEEGIEAKFSSIEFLNWTEAIEFVVRRNEGRRQMDDDDRADTADKLANVSEHSNQFQTKLQKPEKEEGSIDPSSPVTIPQAAKLLKISETTIKRFRYIKVHAIPEVQAAYKAKKITRGRAKDIAHLPKDEQPAELEKWLNVKKNGASKPSRRSILAARAHELTKGPLKLTREQVDPDFKGTSMEWMDTYGHVQVMTKAQLEADRKQQALRDWLNVMNELRDPLRKYQEYLKSGSTFDLTIFDEWLSVSEVRQKRVGEIASLLIAAMKSVEAALPIINKYRPS